jgi:hypothetical protein
VPPVTRIGSFMVFVLSCHTPVGVLVETLTIDSEEL